jgi:hypothetical protein
MRGVAPWVVVLLTLPTVVHGTEIRLAGAGATWFGLTAVTNSVQCAAVLSEVDHSVASTSAVDTCLSLLPAWGAWRDVPDGSLDVWVEVVGDSSNAVSVLLGDMNAPSLTIGCARDWSVVPAGALPADEPAIPRFGVSTNRLHLVLRTGSVLGSGSAFVETQVPGGSWTARPDLALAEFGWLGAAQTVQNWSRVGVWTAGPQAALTELRLRWRVDGTVIILDGTNRPWR